MTRQARTVSSLLEGDTFAWLDGVAEPLQKGVKAIFGVGQAGKTAKNVLNGVPLRHRMHPALIVVPMGAWTMAFVYDAIDLLGGKSGPQHRASANTAIVVGLLGAIPSIAAGLADWVDTYSHQRRVGTAHALLNFSATGLYIASWWQRRNGQQRAGQMLAVLGYGLAGPGAAFGGDLVYTLGVNVSYLLYPKPPSKPVDVLASDELDEGAHEVVAVGEGHVPVLLVRQQGQVLAVENWCPHAGGPLSEGIFEDGNVVCPWHQSRFCLRDGAPLDGPASAPLRTFDVREEHGRIIISPSYEAQDWPPPPGERKNS